MTDKTALLTGVTGFIGYNLAVRLISEGWQVHAVVRPESDLSNLPPGDLITCHEHDGSTESLINIVKCSAPFVVFNLASLFLSQHDASDVEPLVVSNVLFPVQLMEAMAQAGVRRLVSAGTAWQNFSDSSYRPVNLYAATKQAAESLLCYYTDIDALSAVTLRLYDTYGDNDKRRKLIGLLKDAADSEDVLDMSPGEQVIDLTHVEDVVDAFLAASKLLFESEIPVSKVYFVSGERMTVRELVQLFEKVWHKSIPINFGGRPYRVREVMRPYTPSDHNTLPGWRRNRDVETWLTELRDT